tara:strand:+ start:723 stop:1028 length:306 start_codon:yes stop_codon:yes gene_type:complete
MLAVALLLLTLIPPPPRLDDILSHGRAVETVEEVDVLRHRWSQDYLNHWLRLKPDGSDAIVEVIAYEQHVAAEEAQAVGLVEPCGCGRAAVPEVARLLAAD